MNKSYGYVRVSTKEQNLDRQLYAMNEYEQSNCIKFDKIFKDKRSGKNFNRKDYQLMKEVIKTGDTLVIKELDRLGRDMDGIKAEWNELSAKGVQIVIMDCEMLSTKGKSDIEQKLISNIVFELLSYMAQKEREKLQIRVKEGLARAKAKGVKLGRPSRTLPDNFEKYYRKWKSKEINQDEFAKLLNTCRMTIYRYIKFYEAS